MSLRSFMVGGTGPFTYNPEKDYRNETPITDYVSADAISFVAETSISSPKITDPDSLFLTAPNVFYPNAVIEVRGSTNNDGYYLVSTVAADTLYLHEDVALTAETAGAGDVTISTPVQAAYRGLDAFFGSSNETSVTDTDNDTGWETERGADDDTLRGKTAGTDRITIDANGVTLEAGASVNEFSIDDTLSGDSDDAVPTEQAVKAYVDTHEADTTDIHGIVDTSKLNTSDAVIVDHTLVRGDGGAQKVQDSGIVVDDSDNVSAVGTIASGDITITGADDVKLTVKTTSVDNGETASIWLQHERGVGGTSTSKISKYEFDFKVEADEDFYISTNVNDRIKVSSGGVTQIGDAGVTDYTQVAADGKVSMNGAARIAWSKITANNITQGNGGHGAFDVTHIQTAHDGNIYHIDETATDPGFELTVEFISVTAFNWVQLHASYDGRATHSVQIALYNFNTTTWDCYGSFAPSQSEIATAGEYTLENKSFFVPDDTNYIGANGDAGDVRVRIRHTITGNPADDMDIGVVALYQ